MDPEPTLNSNIYENFMKKQFFNLNSNFDQATQKKIKKAILCGKIKFKNTKKIQQQYNVPNKGGRHKTSEVVLS